MYQYIYFVDYCMKSNSLHALCSSIEDYCRNHDGSYYVGKYVFRLIYRDGAWVYDDNFRARIGIVSGKVILRIVK